MDKVFSTRLDEDLIRQLNILATKQAIRKKRLIEKALRDYIARAHERIKLEILDSSFGIWHGGESPEQTISNVRHAFREGFNRL